MEDRFGTGVCREFTGLYGHCALDEDFRVVPVIPPGSPASVIFGTLVTTRRRARPRACT
ncbi:hypothetical protein [Streptomyces hokutonensis]|uniref:hypothetical protein n=1 Tax=Streptomyces hokutonensis TaxID=1306990 RepID=UPI0033FB86A8